MLPNHYIFCAIFSKMGINPNDKCQMPRWVPTLSPLPLQFHQEDTEFSLFSLSSQQEEAQRSGLKGEPWGYSR